DGTLSARGGSNSSRKFKAALVGTRNTDFLKLVERTEDAFSSTEDTAVEEVRRILADVRTQYDNVHLEAERREAELTRLREMIRIVDNSHGSGADESSKKEDSRLSLEKQLTDAQKAIHEAQTAKKVYAHMCGRIQKEQSLLKEKLHMMEAHLGRKTSESHRKESMQERLVRKGATCAQELEILECDVEHERTVREEALANMMTCLQAKLNAKERRDRFEHWRHE
ncbi:unnamed protein product, partial [Polarella glacialis]